jgi:hypothetical protein
MLFAAVAHSTGGIPRGQMGELFPQCHGNELRDLEQARANLNKLSEAIETKAVEGPLGDFVKASLSNAHRMASRSIRFPIFVAALRPNPL